jgi:hypothetical protein
MKVSYGSAPCCYHGRVELAAFPEAYASSAQLLELWKAAKTGMHIKLLFSVHMFESRL